MSTLPILDRFHLDDMTGGDQVFERELLQLFLTDIQTQLAGIELALNQNNPTELQRHAHQVKGSCFNVGAIALGTLAAHLEVQAQTGTTQTWGLLAQMKMGLAELQTHLARV
ncbi:Hpt domain-containing protein [Candidatus Cyanaurora vandensis]|uniref:Hpt domain-containing protein n=1 Tax=Candidatus Cyanaurora vandensis TaxID=2714958 RepID=UPI00257D0307|nr:Hpt domain-containing protein [Candidatus Cyanaurora vandensis]